MTVIEIASGLVIPEGPIAFPDGRVLVVEVLAGRVSLIGEDRRRTTLCEPGGGPNGAAVGPDGRVFICNNGGFSLQSFVGLYTGAAPDATAIVPPNGRIEAIDLKSGKVEVIYRKCAGEPLVGPNDLVFDRHGGFYFTDTGRFWGAWRPPSWLYYARADGKEITRVAGPFHMLNGVGLSPDEATLYVAESQVNFLWAFDVLAPGQLKTASGRSAGARLVYHGDGLGFDSLAVDAGGHICVACAGKGKIARISPDGQATFFDVPGGGMPTNICFGGADLRTAYVTVGQAGTLIAFPWPVPGHPLNFLNR